MSIAVLRINPKPAIQAVSLPPPFAVKAEVTIFSGTIECVFKGTATGTTQDTLSFNILDPNTVKGALRIDIARFLDASGTVSLASLAYDGVVNDALWAVDDTIVGLVNEDSGTGTANVQVSASLAVRSANGIILRVNYIVFVRTSGGAIVV